MPQRTTQKLYFARDPLGRRSLLVHHPDETRPYFLLSSVSAGLHDGYNLEEVSTENIYAIDLKILASTPNVSHSSHLQAIARKIQLIPVRRFSHVHN